MPIVFEERGGAGEPREKSQKEPWLANPKPSRSKWPKLTRSVAPITFRPVPHIEPTTDREGRRAGSFRNRRIRPRRRRRLRKLDLSKTLFVLPNAITLAAVFCGFNSIRIVANARGPGQTDDYYRAAILLIFSMFFDLMDGRVARLTKTQSAFGLQMDSLADIVSFGVAPAVLVHQWVLHRLGTAGLLASFAFVACAAIRLARFNVLSSTDDGQPLVPGKYILGLPSPPASGVLISLVVANHAADDALSDPRYTIAILVMTVAVSLLMVSAVRFRSFKDLKLNAATITLLLFVIGSSLYVWQAYKPQFVLIWLLSFYVLIGLLETIRDFSSRANQSNAKPETIDQY